LGARIAQIGFIIPNNGISRGRGGPSYNSYPRRAARRALLAVM
jgi:hypothetical protein